MYVTWQVLVTGFVALCVGFSSVCAAGGWLIKIVKGMKKPSEDIETKFKATDEKLDRDNKRIAKLEDDMDYLKNAMSLSLRSSLVIMAHMRTDNNTGEIKEQEDEILRFLAKR